MDEGARRKPFMAFCAVDTQQRLRAKGLPVTGVKGDLARGLVESEQPLVKVTARAIAEELRVAALQGGG